jgi:hypothetical protein
MIMKMKLYLILAGFFLLTVQVKAQSPNVLNYQGVARDAAGVVLPNQPIGLEFTIHQGSASGTIVYQETQMDTTNQFGLFAVSIGSGTVVKGNFSTIDWGANSEYLDVAMDPNGGTSYTDMGTQQLLSVPYALYAASSGSNSGITSITGTIPIYITGTVTTPVISIQGLDANEGGILYSTGAGTSAVFTATGAAGQVLESNGAGAPTWVTQTSGAGGTVTSFSADNFSPLFTTLVTNATTAPALSFTAIGQTQNLVFASPNGSTGNPTFRALVNADLPASGVSATTYGNATHVGQFTVNAQGIITSASSVAISPGGNGTTNYITRWTPNGSTLGTGLIQDNDTTVGINNVPVANDMLYVNSTTGNAVYGNGIIGVYGSGGNYGVYGYSSSDSYAGVYGEDDYNIGVEGVSSNGIGIGVQGTGINYGVKGYCGNYGIGVYGSSTSSSYPGIYGINDNYYGVYGGSTSSYGVFGYSTSASFAGVIGRDDNNWGVQGYSANEIGVDGSGNIGGEFSGTQYGLIVPSGGGNVGIGSDAPTTLLQVGNSATTSGKLSVYSQDLSFGQIQIGNPNSEETSIGFISGVTAFGDNPTAAISNDYIWSVGAGAYSIGGNNFDIGNRGFGGPIMTITSGGFMGIDCTTPFYTLDINGDIRASGSVYYGGTACSTAGTAYTKPDYVFEPDYKKSYTPFEVEKFINEKGHLPWVTSAIEEKIENDGAIDITRMSFQTLEAVENTQMQIIEQQKMIIEQKISIDELSAQNDSLKYQNAHQQQQISDLATKVDAMQQLMTKMELSLAEYGIGDQSQDSSTKK